MVTSGVRHRGHSMLSQIEQGGPLSGDRVYVEVEAHPANARQIGPRQKVAVLVQERKDDIEAAIVLVSEMATRKLAAVPDAETGWRVDNIELSFGLKLSADAGVIVSKVSSEASLEIKITASRR